MSEPARALPETELYRTLPEQIAALLRQEVLSGKLKPGEPLREIEGLAALRSQSRPPSARRCAS